MGISKRANTYYLRKWVPRRFKSIEPRDVVWISLETDSPIIANKKADVVWDQHLAAWEAKLDGDTEDAEKRFESAKQLAKIRNFRFLPAAQVATLPAAKLSTRIEAATLSNGELDKTEAAAMLGGIKQPEINVTRALELFWALAAEKALGKNNDQVRRWRNPFKKAVSNFVNVVGDKSLRDLSREDMLDFREWWFERMKEKNLTANSANKDLIHLGNILKTVNNMKNLGIELPISGLSFKESEPFQRPSITESWVQNKILDKGALDGLNIEARCILLGMINTGYRPSEAQGLLPKHIRLDGTVPHIIIEPDGRHLKSSSSRRKIPLVGISLEAFKECPNGFPRYRNKPSLSATVNKYLRDNGLLETSTHSLYGLRHGFEDRMLAAGVDERIRRDLMGHRLNRERYGAGATLRHLQRVIQLVAL